MLASILLAVFFALVPAPESTDTAVKGYLEAQLKEFSSWSITSIVYPAQVVDGTWRLQVDEGRAFTRNGGYAYVPVVLKDAKGHASHTILTVKVSLFRRAFVAARDIKLGEELKRGDFLLDEKDVTNLKGEPVDEIDDVAAYKTKMYIAKGSVLVKPMVRPKPLVKSGDMVTAYLTSNGLVISLEAKAREDGYLGGSVRVISKDKKIYRAVVEANDKVRIIE